MQRLTLVFESADRKMQLPVGTVEITAAGLVRTDAYGTVAGSVVGPGGQHAHWQVASGVLGGGTFSTMRVERSLGNIVLSEGRTDRPQCGECAPHENHANKECPGAHCVCPLVRV